MRAPMRLTSFDNPRIKQIVHLRKHRDRKRSRLFIAEGKREISRALAAGLGIREFFFSAELSGLDAGKIAVEFPAVEYAYELPAPLFEKIAYREKPEGLLATFEEPSWTLEAIPRTAADLFLVAQSLQKPGNLGAMVRTASAAGATAVLIADEDVDPFNPNAIRASTGAVFSMPIVSASSDRLIEFLRSRDIRITTAAPDAETLYTDADFKGPSAIVIGSEDQGVTPEWREAAHALVRIPMKEGVVDSLNAATTAAILLFEAVRQRQAHSGD